MMGEEAALRSFRCGMGVLVYGCVMVDYVTVSSVWIYLRGRFCMSLRGLSFVV